MGSQVFALEPVQVELAGMNPQRIPKGTRITIRSPSRIESIRVLPLHPILTDTEYINLQRQRNTENAGILKVGNPTRKWMTELTRGAGSTQESDANHGGRPTRRAMPLWKEVFAKRVDFAPRRAFWTTHGSSPVQASHASRVRRCFCRCKHRMGHCAADLDTGSQRCVSIQTDTLFFACC